MIEKEGVTVGLDDNSSMQLIVPEVKTSLGKRNLIKMALLAEVGLIVGYNMFIFNPLGDLILGKVYGLNGTLLRSATGDVNLLFSIGSMMACLIAGKLANKFGRRKMILFFQVMIIITMGLYWIENLYVLYFVRFMIGFFSAGQQTVSSVMMKELLPKESSGIGNSLIYTYLGTFIFFAYIQGNLYSSNWILAHWRYLLCWPIIPEIIKLILLPILIPFESPKFLCSMHKNAAELQQMMASIYADTYDEHQIYKVTNETVKVVEDEENNSKVSRYGLLSLFGMKTTRRRMWANILALLAQQLTGTTYYTLYSTDIFNRLGEDGKGKQMTLYIAVTKLVSSFIGVAFVKTFGRKFNILFGCLCEAICSMLVALSILINFPLLSYLALSAFMFFQAIGFGCNISAYLTETLPVSGLSFTIALGWIFQATVAKVMPLVAEPFGDVNMILFFSVTCLSSVLILDYFMIESKGKSDLRVIKEFQTKAYSIFDFS